MQKSSSGTFNSIPTAHLEIEGVCHCGNRSVGMDSKFGPGRFHLCDVCAKVRCDAFPGACESVREYQSVHGKHGSRKTNNKKGNK